METLAAVGLAGNIVQFIDFTYKLFNGAASIHNSRSGLAKGVQDLETVTQDLQDLCAKLSRDDPVQLQGRNVSLHKLARQCLETAEELLSILAKLKVTDADSKWSSFRAALATVFKKAEIEALEKSLDSYRMQMVMQLQKMQEDKFTHIFGLLDQLNHKSEQMSANMSTHISCLKGEVRQAINGLRRDLEIRSSLTQGPPRMESHRATETEATLTATLMQSLIECESVGAKMMVSLAVLESLTFERMDFRHSSIHEAHPKTYDEVFEKEIVYWLRSREPIYWISGKPGSGKSTLMKYIVGNKATRAELCSATEGQDPIVGSYFFWINGTPLQRSQEGLLQSLLYEILRQNTSLIELALPVPWSSITSLVHQKRSSRYDWKRAELMAAFQRLADAGVTASRMCIFIDGLDEYGGDHDQLVNTIRHLVTMKIKMCVASRPWNVFEEAFGRTQSNKLYMQDVNKPDIQLYVNDKLKDRLQDKSTIIRSLDADEIMEEIVEKSQGVFLWVFLVVRSLNDGLRNHDRLSQLRVRLDAFPSDLEEFFNHIFQSMDPTYRVQVAHMFQVALQTNETLTPLAYWFLDEQEDDPEMALTMPISGIPEEEIHDRIEQTSIRINGRCKGLLEIYVAKDSTHSHKHDRDPRVDFLHRTVKDFLMTTRIRETFATWQQEDFDASLAICQASLALIKSIAMTDYTRVPLIGRAIQSCFESAKDLEINGKMTYKAYLDELERLGHHPTMEKFGIRDDQFLCVAIKQDLTLLVQDILPPSTPRTECAKLHYLSFSQSIEMTCIIIVHGPTVMIDRASQKSMVPQLGGKPPGDILAKLRQILNHACLAPNGDGQFTRKLNEFLWKNLPTADVKDLINTNQQRNREYAKLESYVDKIKEKEEKRAQGRKEGKLSESAQQKEEEATGSRQGKMTLSVEVTATHKSALRKSWIRKMMSRTRR